MEKKRLTKSRTDKKIFGVCGGIAEYLNCDSTVIRLILAISILGVWCWRLRLSDRSTGLA